MSATNWWADYDGVAATAVEEIVRWASPVIYMRRTLTEDVELSGVKMAAGDKVTMWYCSANRDEDQVRRPVDLRRRAATPTRMSASAAAARTSAWAPTWPAARSAWLFEELHRQMPDIVGDGGAGAAAVGVHPRHQAAAGRVDAAVLILRPGL